MTAAAGEYRPPPATADIRYAVGVDIGCTCVWIRIDLRGAGNQLAVDIIGVLVVAFFQPFELVYNHGGHIGKELGAISFGKEM